MERAALERVGVAALCAMFPHPAASKNNVKTELANVFFTICIAFPFRSRTGHPLKPACVVARYGDGIRCSGEYDLVEGDTTGPGDRMRPVEVCAEI